MSQRRFRAKVLNGGIKIHAKDLPSFLYPNGTVYDPDNIDHNLFRGHIFLQVGLFYILSSPYCNNCRFFVSSIPESHQRSMGSVLHLVLPRLKRMA